MLQTRLTAFFFCLLFSTIAFGQDVVTGTLSHDGLTRDYRLYIPPANSTGEALPLVFNFHGFTSNAGQQQLYSAMDLVADTAGFFVCYPNGIARAWNVGWDFGSTADDVGFTAALIDELSANYNIDPNRVYACGMSNGGFMSYRLACELNDKIAAIASVTGSMVPGSLDDCSPGRAVPVLEIHGTADDVVPYEGQANLCINIDTLVHFWATNNNCGLSPTVESLPDINTADGCTVTRIDYNDCQDGRRVSLMRVNGGGHTWPGAFFSLGVTNQDIDASVEIWRFFHQFTLEGVTGLGEMAVTQPLLGLYPNPASTMLRLEPETTMVSVNVYNTFGQLIHQMQLSRATTLDVSSWQTGVYFLEAAGPAGRSVHKVVKR